MNQWKPARSDGSMVHQQAEIGGGPRQEIRDGKVCDCWLTASMDMKRTHSPASISQT